MMIVNSTGAIGLLLIYMTQNITGSEFLTYIFLYFLYIMGGFIFKLPLELIFAFSLPLVLLFTLVVANFVPILSFIAIFFAFFLAKTFIAN